MILKVASLVLAALMLTAIPGIAHHSFVMFDQTKQVTLSGTVTSYQWTNPHCYIEVDVADASGATKHWSIEMGSPSILLQSGWKHNTLKKGDQLTAIVNPLKNGDPGSLLGLPISMLQCFVAPLASPTPSTAGSAAGLVRRSVFPVNRCSQPTGWTTMASRGPTSSISTAIALTRGRQLC